MRMVLDILLHLPPLRALRDRQLDAENPFGGYPNPMRATRAYIASLGTAGVLVASSALLLVVVSTLVAFNAWPGGDAVTGLKGLVVDDDQSSLALTGPARVAADAAP